MEVMYEVIPFSRKRAEKANYYYGIRITSDELEVREDVQYFLDGLTIKHVQLQTDTLAFYIQHCYGSNFLFLCGIINNCQPSDILEI